MVAAAANALVAAVDIVRFLLYICEQYPQVAVAVVRLLLYMCEQYRGVSARPCQDLPGHGHLGNCHVAGHSWAGNSHSHC